MASQGLAGGSPDPSAASGSRSSNESGTADENGLESRVPTSSFCVIKHLRVLEAAGLVTNGRRGREKLHIPSRSRSRLVHDRWGEQVHRALATAISALGSTLEEGTMEKVLEISSAV